MLANAFRGTQSRFCVVSFTSDWLFPTADARAIVRGAISDAALYLPFALLPPFSPLWTGVVIVLAVVSEYAGALGPLVGASRHYEGPMGKSDRAFVFGALGLWAGLATSLPDWLALVMPALAAALVVTIVNRVRGGLREDG